MKKEELKTDRHSSGKNPSRHGDQELSGSECFSGKIQKGDIALCGDKIAGIGEYQGVKEIDAQEDMRFRDLLTAIFILNLPMSARKSLEDC